MKFSVIGDSCNISNKGKSCCSTTTETNNEVNLKEHRDKAYLNSPENKLGWYETDPRPMLKLILKTGLNKSTHISIVGARNTTLVDELLDKEYSNIIATNISKIALKKLESRVGNNKVEFIIDDLTKPTKPTKPTKKYYKILFAHRIELDKKREFR